MARTIKYKEYVITREDNGSVAVTKNGELQSNSKAALKEISSKVGFEVEDKWNSQQVGVKLISYMEKNNIIATDSLGAKVEASSAELAGARVKVYGKAQNRTVLGICHAYMIMYPHATYADLCKAFPADSLRPGTAKLFVDVKSTDPADKAQLAGSFIMEEELIKTGDGKKVALVMLWTKECFERIVAHAKQYGIVVADFEKAEGGAKRGHFRLEYLNGYVPPVPGKKKSLWWIWLLLLLLLGGIAAFFALRKPQVVEVEKIVEVEKVVYVDRVEEIEKNFNAATFVAGKADLSDDAKFVLHDLAQLMQKHPALKLKLVGHTSPEGDPVYNQKLSEARAQAAVDFLVSRGVAVERLEAEGKGSSEPIDVNNPEVNRRTEFIVIE